MTTWADLHAYILRIAPDLREAMVGVPEADIAACERDWQLELPSAYRSFLACMGAGAGHFSPFPGQEWNFYTLLRDPPDEYRPRDYFRVAIENEPSLVVTMESYLDMATVQPNGDCELFEAEWLTDPAHTSRSRTKTFLEHMTRVSWFGLDGRRFAYDRQLDGPKSSFEGIHAGLKRAGFASVFPPKPRLSLWSTPKGSPASAYSRDSYVLVASDDEHFLEWVAHILNSVAGVRIDRREPSVFERWR